MILIILAIWLLVLLNVTAGGIMWTEGYIDYYNPVIFYRYSNFNIIGVTVITILLYTFTLPVAVFYWIYKLLTM